MEPTSKLRVAIADGEDALQVVTAEIEEAIGIGVEPEFQEIERGDLVVELRLADPSVPDSRLVAHAVERLSGDIEVLSAWQEVPLIRDPTPTTSQSVFAGTEGAMPEVAQRAIRDELPTATWKSSWQLAVPVQRGDGQVFVGVQDRQGYSRRFGLHEVNALRLGLAS